MKIDMREELGRRYEFADGSAPDVTVVGYDPKSGMVRLHTLGGGRQTIELALFERAVLEGALVVAVGAPFVNPIETKFDRMRAERMKHRDAKGIATRRGVIPWLAYRNGKRA